jgi:arylsulfatase A-like enzyme
MRWPSRIPAASVCSEVAATIDILPTVCRLAGADLPERKIDGHDIWPLMSAEPGAKSPRETYCLMHGPGTVRAGQWKFYPWPEGRDRRRNAAVKRKPVSDPVQLYDVVADIGETKNIAAEHPEIVAELQAAYDAHVKEIQANKRPAAEMTRTPGAFPATRP